MFISSPPCIWQIDASFLMMAHLVAGSIFAIPIKAGRRKKHESESKPLQEVDKVPAQGKVYAPESPFLPSHFASAEKGEESESEEHFPSVPYSGEIHIADPPSNVKKVQSPQLVPTSGILAMVLPLSLFPSLLHTSNTQSVYVL